MKNPHLPQQPISLAMLRSDLMLETNCPKLACEKQNPYCCWKQVEVNSIAAGFGWLGQISGEIHR